MSTPDRPTREQIARSITNRIDWTPTVLAGSDPRVSIVEQVLSLAEHETNAEVRALRAELKRWESGNRRKSWPEVPGVPNGVNMAARLLRAQGEDDELNDLLRSAAGLLADQTRAAQVVTAERDQMRAALVARTPQPAGLDESHPLVQAAEKAWTAIQNLDPDVTEGAPMWFVDDPEQVPDEFRALFEARDALVDEIDRATLTDAAPLPAVPDGEYADLRARWLAHVAEHGTGPGPILPPLDGGDAHDLAEIRRLTEVHPDAPRGELLAEVRRLVENDDHCTEAHRASDGEDVPARLDAAADALAGRTSDRAQEAVRHLRWVAEWLLRVAPPEMRAAVAAALARPTEREK